MEVKLANKQEFDVIKEIFKYLGQASAKIFYETKNVTESYKELVNNKKREVYKIELHDEVISIAALKAIIKKKDHSNVDIFLPLSSKTFMVSIENKREVRINPLPSTFDAKNLQDFLR